MLNATQAQIRDALDLPATANITVNVNYDGDPVSVISNERNTSGALLGFPTGPDNDFLMLSTGIASHIDSLPNTAPDQGTDLGPLGATGDTATISFTIPVPASSQRQIFKFDFMFLSEEFPEYVGSPFNDFFTAEINGANVALDQSGNLINVNNVFFSEAGANGTFFDGRTILLTASYPVPAGVTSLDVQFSIGDVGDGIYDSAVLLDNVRFESPQVVYLDFDGGSLDNFFGPLTSFTVPAFQASDVGSNRDPASLISQITAAAQSYFNDLDIDFVNVQPTSGEFMHVLIGGDNQVPITVFDPLIAPKIGFTPAFIRYAITTGELTPGGRLYGRAESVDIGNYRRSDRAVIFSGEFADYYGNGLEISNLEGLAITIAHEVAHNLGARHVADYYNDNIMRQYAPIRAGATFPDELQTLAELTLWKDHATAQNSRSYLKGVLGVRGAASSLNPGFNPSENANSLRLQTTVFGPIYNLHVGIIDGSAISSGTSGDGEIHTVQVPDGATQFTLPNPYANPKIIFYGSTTPGGPINVFSGQATNGQLDYQDAFVPLFNGDGTLNTQIPLSVGTPGSLQSGGTAALSPGLLPSSSNIEIEARSDAATTLSGNAVVINVLDNDSVSNGATLSIAAVGAPTYGSAVISADGRQIIYTPPYLNFRGVDSFFYMAVSSIEGQTAIAQVTVTVGNRNPNAVSDLGWAISGETAFINVLANDNDPEGDVLAIASVGAAANGTTAIVNGRLAYTPVLGFVGTDTVTYTISDALGGSAQGSVSIVVSAPPLRFTAPVGTIATRTTKVLFNSRRITVIDSDQSTVYQVRLTTSSGKLQVKPSSATVTGNKSRSILISGSANGINATLRTLALTLPKKKGLTRLTASFANNRGASDQTTINIQSVR